MATNIKYEPGWSLNLTCTKPDKPNSGDPVRIGNLTGIALTDEDAAGKTVVNTGPFVAKFAVKDNGGSGIAVGDTIWYHDDATPVLDNVSTGGYYYGIALETIIAEQTATIQVYHDCAPGGAGTIGNGTVGATQLASNAVTTDKILNANVTVPKLSATANSRPIIVPLGTVSATTSQVAFVAPTAGSLNAAKIVTKDAVAADDTDYWTFALTNKGAAGADTDKIVEMTTEATGGTGLAAYTPLSLGTLSATHKVLAAGDVVLFTATKSADATALDEAALMLEFLPAEAE
jgi:predicted RecA/RadA family phage recombinase